MHNRIVILACLLLLRHLPFSFFFFFNDTATTEIYTLSLHDALPISVSRDPLRVFRRHGERRGHLPRVSGFQGRSEEHTSELQSPCNLVCRLLLEKKKRSAVPATRYLGICCALMVSSSPAPASARPMC